MSQEENLDALYAEYLDDERFDHLRGPGIYFVRGYGPLNPELMIVGEAPGKLENARRIPFVGKAGAILSGLLEGIDVDPHKVFMTNTVKYWPNNQGNTRSPDPSEVESSKEYLLREIDIVNPRFVGLCGKFALEAVFPECRVLHKWNGKLLKGKFVPLFHPVYSAYRPEKKPLVKEGFDYLKKYMDKAE